MLSFLIKVGSVNAILPNVKPDNNVKYCNGSEQYPL